MNIFILLFTFCVGTLARALDKRDVTFGLYAYGEGINGLPLVYGKGIAYIGAPPSNHTGSTNVTMAPSTADTSAWMLKNSTAKFYINTAASAYEPAGFTNGSADASLTTTGFSFYGHTVVWVDPSNNNSVDARFWAVGVESGSWLLYWNQGGSRRSGAVPVVLRDVAPVEH